MIRDDAASSPDDQGTIPQAALSCQIPTTAAAGAKEVATEGHPGKRFDEGAVLTLLTDDPRAQLIQQQRLITQNSQRRPKRLKTEQLPLETTPRDFQTCALLLIIATDRYRFSHLFSNASRVDTWLVDGKLKGAFEEGTCAEDAALLVEPLLTRIGRGALLTF
jgi:hypothetical protein